MATVETHSNLEDFRKTTKSVSGLIGYILSGILVLVCGCGPSAYDLCIEAGKKRRDGSLTGDVGKIMEAFHDYSKIIDKYPNCSEAYNGQGNCYSYKESKSSLVDLQNAVNSYTKAIELDRKNKGPYMNRADCYVYLGKNLEAYDDASKAIELDPSDSSYYNSRANILYKMNRNDDALKDMNKAISIDDGYMDYYQYRAALYQKMNKIDKAEDDVDRALKCSKVSNYTSVSSKEIMSHICCFKGTILDGKGDIKGALDWFSKAMHEDEENPRPYFLRSDLYKRKGWLRDSESDLAKAKELKEKSPKRFR